MTNALAYTPADGYVTVQTAVQLVDNQPWVTLTVRDTGPGISAEDLSHIFERFYRGAAARDYRTPGTGLGLSISQAIITRLGGRLTVDSSLGQGAVFTIWLPVA
jgi:two-component system sensor histidine kinase BaeS